MRKYVQISEKIGIHARERRDFVGCLSPTNGMILKHFVFGTFINRHLPCSCCSGLLLNCFMSDDVPTHRVRMLPRKHAAATSPPSLLSVLLGRYTRALSLHPLRTKALTSSCVAAAGEVLASRLSAKRPLPGRVARFALLGLLWTGPALHAWQKRVERFPWPRVVAVLRLPRCALWPVPLLKTLLDQLTFGPVNNVVFLSFACCVLDRKGLAELQRRLVVSFPSVQRAAWRFWPLVAWLNYAYVPPALRALTANGAGLVWSTHLAMKARATAKRIG